MPGVCTVSGCGRPALSRGFCNRHYLRWWTHGDPLATRINRDHSGRCSRRGCGRPYHAKGLCKLHYQRAAPPPAGLAVCWADGCGEPPDTQTGLCAEHRRTAEEWEAEAEEAHVTCCFKGCGGIIDPDMYGSEVACCPHHRRVATYAMELEQWGVLADAVPYIDFPDWLSAKWIAAILGRKKRNRKYLARVTGDTPLFKVITSTLGDLYHGLPFLGERTLPPD